MQEQRAPGQSGPPGTPRDGILPLTVPGLLLLIVFAAALGIRPRLPAPSLVAARLAAGLRPWLPSAYPASGTALSSADLTLHRRFDRLGAALGAGPGAVDQALAPTDRLLGLAGGRTVYPAPGGVPDRPGAGALTAALKLAWRKTTAP